MVDITEISAVVAAAGVLVGVAYYILDMRHQSRVRQTELLVRLAPWLNMSGTELQQAYVKVLNLESKDYDAFVRRYGSPLAEKPEQMALMTVGNYFEAIGTLLTRKLIDVELVWDYWGETFITLWEEKYKDYVDGIRKQFHHPEYGDAAEYLYNEMKKREQQQASKTA
jgi:hypothetical protein